MKKIFLLIFLFISQKSFSQDVEAKLIFGKMMTAMQNVKTCSFVLDIQERIKDVLRFDQFVVKLNSKPYKVYIYSVTPNPGAEGLLIKGENNNKSYINPNRFPFFTMSLSPYSMLLRKNHQYTLWHFGFNYMQEVLKNYNNKYGEVFYSYLHMDTEVKWKGESYYQLVIEKNDFKFENYVVKKGEDVVKIGDKLFINDYMILESNPQVKHFDDVKEGQVIKVPNAFGKKIVLYLDKTTFLPIVQIMYDHKGLYSRVELSSFVLNPPFKQEDFSKENKKYGF